jgi:hypothetical protein
MRGNHSVKNSKMPGDRTHVVFGETLTFDHGAVDVLLNFTGGTKDG